MSSNSSDVITLLKSIQEQIKDLSEEVRDNKTDLSFSIISLKMELLEENKKMGRRIREVKETLDSFSKIFDSYLQETRRKVARVEDHLKLPPLTD